MLNWILSVSHRFARWFDDRGVEKGRTYWICWGCQRRYVGEAFNFEGRLLCSKQCDGVMQRLAREAGL